jgi:hypothetical protein
VPFKLSTVEEVDDALDHLREARAVALPPTRATLARICDAF